MNSEIDGQMLLISQYYPPDVYSQLVVSHQQGPTENNNSKKPKRRRKKSKCDENVSMRKRKLSEEQVNLLEQSFEDEHKLESERKDRLASELGLDPRQVAVWFQNRRARWKSKQLEEEYVRLKSEHETTVVEKCRLETQLLKLKEQLGEAEKEIYRMSESRSVVDGFSSNSPRSSFSMEAIEPTAFLGMTNDLNNVIYNAPEINYVNGMEWDFYHYM